VKHFKNTSILCKPLFGTRGTYDLHVWPFLLFICTGCNNGIFLKEQGYDGSERTVYRYLEPLKQAEVRASIDVHRLQKWTVNAAIWLFVRDPEKLDEIEREDLAAFCEASAPLKKAHDLLQDFLSMVHKRAWAAVRCLAGQSGRERTARTPVHGSLG